MLYSILNSYPKFILFNYSLKGLSAATLGKHWTTSIDQEGKTKIDLDFFSPLQNLVMFFSFNNSPKFTVLALFVLPGVVVFSIKLDVWRQYLVDNKLLVFVWGAPFVIPYKFRGQRKSAGWISKKTWLIFYYYKVLCLIRLEMF